jgi:hypothetical protein
MLSLNPKWYILLRDEVHDSLHAFGSLMRLMKWVVDERFDAESNVTE